MKASTALVLVSLSRHVSEMAESLEAKDYGCLSKANEGCSSLRPECFTALNANQPRLPQAPIFVSFGERSTNPV